MATNISNVKFFMKYKIAKKCTGFQFEPIMI